MPELRKGTAVLVTGTPGTGKTTTSRLLARELRSSYLDPRSLLRHKGCDYVYDRNRRTLVVSLKRLSNALRKRAARVDRGLVIDSHIALETDLQPSLVKAIVLRCDPLVLERRLERKRWSKSKIGENLLAEILDVCLWDAVKAYGWNRVLEIDTTRESTRHVVQRVMKDLEKKRVQKQPQVDWLSTLKLRGILDQYLK